MPKYLFVTGALAADALTDTLAQMEPEFEYDIRVMNITIAAWMNTRYVAKKLKQSPAASSARPVSMARSGGPQEDASTVSTAPSPIGLACRHRPLESTWKQGMGRA